MRSKPVRASELRSTLDLNTAPSHALSEYDRSS
jgi:hypothetical protein